MSSTKQQNVNPPLLYRLFFLYIEPISALVGAYFAAFKPNTYLSLLSVSGSTAPVEHALPTETYVSLIQLANLYLLFALNEHLVLSGTSSLKTWRRLLFCLLIADFGHLISMMPLGTGIYWKLWEWNAMAWGSVGFVYFGATMRITFLAGCGVVEGQAVKRE